MNYCRKSRLINVKLLMLKFRINYLKLMSVQNKEKEKFELRNKQTTYNFQYEISTNQYEDRQTKLSFQFSSMA